MGTTEEALAQAEKLGFNTNLLPKIHLMKISKFQFLLTLFNGLWFWSNFWKCHDQRDLDFARKYKLKVILLLNL